MNLEKTPNTLFNRALDEIKTNKKLRDEGKHIAIPYPFPRLSQYLAGTTKGRYIIVTANSKVGKTKLADFLYVYSPIWFKLNNKTNIKPKVIYFTLEMSKEDKMMEAFCHYLYIKHGVLTNTEELTSLFEDRIVDDKLIKMIEDAKDSEFFKYFNENVIFIDNIRNPYGIYKYVRDYAHSNGVYVDKQGNDIPKNLIEANREDVNKSIDYYKPFDEDEFLVVLTDHVSLLTPEKEDEQSNKDPLHSAMGRFSSKYCLAIRDRWKYIPVNVQQQAAAQEGVENAKMHMLQPSANGLADNKKTGRDADLILGLFSPARFRIANYPNLTGYSIADRTRTQYPLLNNYRELSVIFTRRGDSINTSLFFNGASNYFKELPKPDNMNETIYKSVYDMSYINYNP